MIKKYGTGFVFVVICLLQIITIAKINRVQNTIREDNPKIPYDDYVTSDQVNPKDFKGTAYNPEGPAGVEGQIPPGYSDMSNVIRNRIKERE